MIIPLSMSLALLAQSFPAVAQMDKMGSGLRVYPGTGPLSTFKGVSWKYNGEMNAWASNTELEFVPTIKNGSAVQNLEANPSMWLASPEVKSVLSLELRESFRILGGTRLMPKHMRTVFSQPTVPSSTNGSLTSSTAASISVSCSVLPVLLYFTDILIVPVLIGLR